jgi:phosphohistidine phosphatase SixA
MNAGPAPTVGRPESMMPVIIALALLVLAPTRLGADEALWDLLRAGGQVVLMRHATTTPGVGDPPGFRPGDCPTQRNLTDAGREEARRVGAAFRSRDIPIGLVLSSQWCRCLETARLAFGRAEPWAALDSVFEDRAREPERTGAVRKVAGERPVDGNLVLMTHGANIMALVGVNPAPGEFVVLVPESDGRFRVAGRIAPSALR